MQDLPGMGGVEPLLTTYHLLTLAKRISSYTGLYSGIVWYELRLI